MLFSSKKKRVKEIRSLKRRKKRVKHGRNSRCDLKEYQTILRGSGL